MISRTINVYDGCRHILMLMTSHIGWEGDWASVEVNSQVFYDSLTRPGGEQGFPVYAEDGDIITFTYHGDALYNNTYHFWELVDYEGNTLLEGTGEPHAVIEQTATANCPGSNEANILTFSFNVTENPSLFADITGTIDPATFSITLDVPENVDLSSLIATFTLSDLASAAIGGVSQESGVTANDFSAPVVYTITAEAGNTQDWTVMINLTECAQPWEYLQTEKVHNISIPFSVAPEIFGTPLAAFDWIGVFFVDDNGDEVCGGAVQWDGESSVVMNAYGDDGTTSEKDGFAAGEAFRWRLQQCGNPVDYTALAAYDATMPNQGNFADFGLSKLTSLQAAFIQDYELNQGWNSMSSYIVPFDAAVESMFAPMVNQLTILRNLNSLYWPAEGMNTIGDWDNFSGYVLKATEALGFQVTGAEYAPGDITVPAGWSYLPVLSQCDADAMEMFGDHLGDVVIIQELIGTGVFWPAFEIYSLETFVPGKAYIIKLNNEVTVSFPDCIDKGRAELPKRVNQLETAWGNISMTPVSQVSMFMEEAMEDLVQGDVIGAFDQDGYVFGYLAVNGRNENQSMTLFGDDLVSQAVNGFMNDEPVSYKLMRTSTDEVFDLEVVYSPILENTSGNFVAGSFAAISDLKLSATGMGEMTSSPIGFYPNPASDNITITGIAGQAEVGIFNVFGEEVFFGIISGSTNISLSDIAKGTYLVRISDDSSVSVKKLVIK
jgi:hypothetical protein